MTALVVSDLHLGVPSRGDVLRVPAFRTRLLEHIAAADEVVLLGDIVELREGPPGPALEVAEAVLPGLGEAAAGRRVTIVPGNHDHRLVGRWLRTRRHRQGARLGLEERIAPADASPEAERIAAALGPATVEFAYPGMWLRPEVYALHGHHLDRHLTVPSFERLGLAGVERWGLQGRADGSPDGYEAVFGPLYALLFALAEESPPADGAPGAGSSTRAWRVLVGSGARKRPVRHRVAAAAGFPTVIALLNRAGLGPLRPRISAPELRRAGLLALRAALDNLGVTAPHVVFGHTHRAGPFAGDDLAEWARPGGGVVNGGSWVYQPLFMGRAGGRNPYWPGNCVEVPDAGPPRIHRLLADLDREAIAAAL